MTDDYYYLLLEYICKAVVIKFNTNLDVTDKKYLNFM